MSIFRSTPYKVITSQTLTASFVDTQPIYTEGFSDCLLLIDYTTGAAETNNVINIKMKSSSGVRSTSTGMQSEADKYDVVVGADSAGDIVLSDVTLKYTGAAAATQYKKAFPITLQDDYLTFSVAETGVSSNFGTLSIQVILFNRYQ